MPSNKRIQGFTLIEILVVIAIVAILATVVILALNPAEILRRSRDTNRINDLSTLNTALSAFRLDKNLVPGNQNTVYLSVPDSDPNCGNLGMPSLAAGWSYKCVSSSTLRNTDGTGWIPVDFGTLSFGAPISSLPVDPSNSIDSSLFFTFVPSSTGWELTASFESQKYLSSQYSDSGVYAVGPTLGITPNLKQSDLLAHWRFEEGTGGAVTDSSGKNYNGTFYGTGSRWSGTAHEGSFSGLFSTTTKDVVGTPVINELKGVTEFTVMAWVNPTALSSGGVEHGVVSKGSASTWKLAIKNGAPLFYVYAGGVMDGPWTGSVSAGQWTHLAGVYNGSNVILYKNGVELGRTSKSGVTDSFNFATTIGAQSTGGFNPYSGLIDDVRVYNRALSASEISALASP